MIEGQIQGMPVDLLLDPGAQASVMSSSFYSSLEDQPSFVSKAKLRGLGGKWVDAYKINAAVKIGKRSSTWPFYVVDNDVPILLGWSFLKANRCFVDFSRDELYVGGESIPMKTISNKAQDRQVSRVTVATRQVVPPNCMKRVKVKFENPPAHDRFFCIESQDANKKVLLSNTLVRGGRNAYVSVINDSNYFLTLKKDTYVGVASQVEELVVEDNGTMQDDSGPSINLAESDPVAADKQSKWDWRQEFPSGMTEADWQQKLAEVVSELPDYMMKMFVDSVTNLSSEEATRFGMLLLTYKHIFSAHEYDIGTFEGVRHRIDTADCPPVKQKMRRMPLAFQAEEKDHLDKMLNMGVFEPSTSDWASPPVLVRKADGSLRYCVDFRELNKRTVKDCHPLPLIEDCLDALSGNKYFTHLDMSWGYYQILLADEDKKKTAFMTRYGLFQHTRMAFGLTNAPATFQRAMNLVLRGINWKTVLAYLDDVLVLGKGFWSHMENIETCFQRVDDSGMKLKPRKCIFFCTETVFLGRKITQEGILIDEKKIEALKSWPRPETRKQLQSFLGFTNYHRDHIAGYSEIAAPLCALAGSRDTFDWTDLHTERFQQLKEVITTAPCLAYPRPEGTFILDCDASDDSIGACLSQIREDGIERPIAFASNVLLKEQRRYCTTRKELLSLVKFSRHFRHYLLGQKFVVRTDHNCLVWLMNFRHIEGQLARWMEELSQYNMDIQHRAGKKHGNADGMSRVPDPLQPCTECNTEVDPSELPCHPCKFCQRAHEQWSDFKSEVDDAIPLARVRYLEKRRLREERATTRDQDDYSSAFQQLLDPGSPTEAGREDMLASSPTEGCKEVYYLGSQDRDSGSESDGEEEADLENQERDQGPNWLQQYSLEELKSSQNQDQSLVTIIDWIQSGQQPSQNEIFSSSTVTKVLWRNKDLLQLKKGLLYYQWVTLHEDRLLWIAPKGMRKEILEQCHDTKTSGHLGVDKTIARVRQRFFWPGMTTDVSVFIKGCSVCNRVKKSNHYPKARQKLYHAGRPMERVHLDILGPFQASTSGMKYVLVIVDQFSKWVECVALEDQSASTIAYEFLAHFIAYFGCPWYVHTDQGKNFEGNLFQAFCELFQIVKTRTTPFHPQGNAQCETKNRLILQLIRTYIEGRPRNWDWYLPFICFALHTTVNRTTGFTPHMLLFGEEATLPVDVLFGAGNDQLKYGHAEWVKKTREALLDAQDHARSYMKAAQLRQKNVYDQDEHERSYSVGDSVLKREITAKKGSKALGPVWSGPFIVLKARHPVYVIQGRNSQKHQVLHHDRLKPCTDRTTPMWLRRRRHAILNLDETLPYDEAELDDDDFEPPQQPQRVNGSKQKETKGLAPVPGGDEEEEDEPIWDPVRKTSRGRQVRLPARLLD